MRTKRYPIGILGNLKHRLTNKQSNINTPESGVFFLWIFVDSIIVNGYNNNNT